MIIRPIAQRWSPRLLPKLRLWLNADDRSAFLDGSSNPITNGASIEKWYCSQFGYDFNAQSTVSKRPVWNSTGMGTKSKPYVQFDGVTDLLKCIDVNLISETAADTLGTIIIIGANSIGSGVGSDTAASIYYFNSADDTSNNNIGVRSRRVSQIYYNGITNNQSGNQNQVRQSQGVTSGANDEVYYLSGSDGTQYLLRTITNIGGVDQLYNSKITELNNDDGDWFDMISGRDNFCIGGFSVNGVNGYSYCRIAEIIVTGEDIYSDATTLSYLDRYIKSKYGNLVNA